MRTKGIEGKLNLLLDTHVIVLGVGLGGGGLAAKKNISVWKSTAFNFDFITCNIQIHQSILYATNKANLEFILKAVFSSSMCMYI